MQRSHTSDDAHAQISLDIAGAYPEEAGIKTWVRTVTLYRGKAIVVTDSYDLKAITGEITLNLVTPCKAVLDGTGQIALNQAELTDGRSSGSARIAYDSDRLAASVEETTIQDNNLKRVWGKRLTRIVLKAKNPLPKDTWILRIIR